MSYAIYFFVRAENCTVQEINDHLAARDEDDGGVEEPITVGGMPLRFVEQRFDDIAFAKVLLKPYLLASGEAQELLVELDEDDAEVLATWLDSEQDEVPEQLVEHAESIFEYESEDGLLPLMFEVSDRLAESIPAIADLAGDPALVRHRIEIFDPQLNRVLVPGDPSLPETIAEAVAAFEEAMEMIGEDDGDETAAYSESLPEGSHADLTAMNSPQVVIRISESEGAEPEEVVVGTFGELLLALEVLDNCIAVLANLDEAPGEGAPRPSELADWVESLSGEEQEGMEVPFNEMLTAGALENGFDPEVLEFPLSIRRLATLLFVIGDSRAEDEVLVGYLLLRYSLGALTSVGPVWAEMSDDHATQMEVGERFLNAYCEACEQVFETDKTLACMVVKRG